MSKHKWQLDYCWPSRAAMARELGRTERTVTDLLAELVAAGRLEIRRPNRQKGAQYHLIAAAPDGQFSSPQTAPDGQKTSRQEPRLTGRKLPVRTAPDGQFSPRQALLHPYSENCINHHHHVDDDAGNCPSENCPSVAAEALLETAAEALRGCGLGKALALRYAADDWALAIVVANYFRERNSPDRLRNSKPVGLGLLIRWLQQPLDHDFTRLDEAAPAVGPDDAYRVWNPPADSNWRQRFKAAASAEELAKRASAAAARDAENRRSLAAEREHREQLWGMLLDGEREAIRGGLIAQGTLHPTELLCQAQAVRLFAAVEDHAREELLDDDDRRRAQAEAARSWPLFFGCDQTRRGAVMMAWDFLERVARRERAAMGARS